VSETAYVNLGYPRTPTVSPNLSPQQNVNKTTLSHADIKAYSRPEQQLTETTASPVLQMKWNRTFSTTRSAFRAIGTLAGQKQSQPVLSCIRKMDGTPCRFNEEVMQHCSEHFTDALNHLPATTSTSLESESISPVPDPNVRTDELTVDEDIRASKS